MSDENHVTSEEQKKEARKFMYRKEMTGRRMILTSETEINSGNVAKVVEQAFITHLLNRDEIDYLWNYYKGKQPSLYRVRELRDDLTKHIVENRANEIVSFKVGFMVGKPVQYVSSNGQGVSKAIAKLNDSMRMIGKATKDKELVEWCMIAGLGYRYVVQNKERFIKVPFNLYTLDPRDTFVIRANDYSKRVLAGVNYVTDENGQVTFTVYTDDFVYTLIKGKNRAEKRTRNAFGAIPIIEYPANNARLGSFEIVLSLLDAISEFDCARNEAVEQFVQSLLVLYNCQVEEGTTADTIRQAGMILLKSMNGEKADVKNLSEQLDQTQNQTLKSDMYNAVLQIVGMPSQGDGNTGDSSNNGAVILKNGWQGAETRAEAFEAMFKLPETEMLNVVSVLCAGLADFTFSPSDIDIKFTRHSYDNLLSKSQTLTTMLASDKIHPKCAYEASGLFTDTEEAASLGLKWYDQVKKEQAEQMNNIREQSEKVKPDAEE